MVILGAMQTPDGSWRVEAVRDRGGLWYRVVHGGQVHADGLAIASVERIMRDEAHVTMGALVEVVPAEPGDGGLRT